ncbi:dihydrofolate reductase family protein [Kineococcus gynurae]|uniref:Dihydrofolate reductase family protein n=1 Tax=Kineococcus gynurae TaxID=452979 RepID=A0ABV5LX40_9ACTN
MSSTVGPGLQDMARDLVLTQNVTLDGVVDMSAGWADPGREAPDPAQVALNAEHMAAESALLLGRRTFVDFRGFWPAQAGTDTTGISAHLDAVPKHVVSATLGDPGWAGTTVHRGDAVETVVTLKAGEGGEICCTGSITLAHVLLTADLVDEVRTFVHPVVVGAGRRLFPDGGAPTSWRPVAARTFTTGVTFAAYRRS